MEKRDLMSGEKKGEMARLPGLEKWETKIHGAKNTVTDG